MEFDMDLEDVQIYILKETITFLIFFGKFDGIVGNCRDITVIAIKNGTNNLE